LLAAANRQMEVVRWTVRLREELLDGGA